jgi:hypothetical protein
MQKKIRQQEISKKEQHRQMRQQNTDERVLIALPQLVSCCLMRNK